MQCASEKTYRLAGNRPIIISSSSSNGEEEEHVYVVGGKAIGKEATRKTKT
jgi:hypothetical protein